MKRILTLAAPAFLLALLLAGTAAAQEPPQPKGWVGAQFQFEKNCSKCHGNAAPQGEKPAPTRAALMKLSADAVYASMTTGSMTAQAAGLTDDLKRLIAENLGGRPVGVAEAGDAKAMTNRCASNPPMSDPSAGPDWNGWSNDATNTRFQSAQAAGLTAAQVPSLKLKWAFGVPEATEMYSQPAVVSGRIFIGGDSGYVYSLDAATGCVYWSFLAQAGVRTAPSVGAVKTQGARYAVYFGDQRANEYAVNAETGALLWKVQVEEHPLAHILGAPKLYNGRLYVPVSSGEEGISESPAYPCCTFRGSIVALDAETGKQIWKTYSVPEAPKPTKKNSAGVQMSAPAGAAIWNSPTIDVKRNALYVGTGDSYTEPAAKYSDAILAMNLETGKLLWEFQDIRNDSWMVGCEADRVVGNCPKELGPDYDFSVSPMLRTMPNGKQFLVVSGKSGYVLALDPDNKGKMLWKTPLFQKPPTFSGLIVFGGASDEQDAYYALNQVGGMAAVDMLTGERKWFTPLAPGDIPGEVAPRPGQSAAVTAIPGVVFSGGWDGRLRAIAAGNGSVIWEYNTAHDYTTVNGVPGKGGSMGAPGPTVVGGTVYVGSGYVGVSNGLPGNVLLAFSAQ